MSARRTIAVSAFLLAFVAAGCGSVIGTRAPSTPEASPPVLAGFESTQRSEGGEVTVQATWAGTAAGAVFHIKLDTHSVDLDGLDMADAVLTNDRGEHLAATPWQAPRGGHHREGALTFSGDAATFFDGTRWIELTFTGVGSVPERVLRWELPA